MIRTFADRDAERLWEGQRVRRFSRDVEKAAMRKLRLINNAVTIQDLRIPPGNRLEALSGARSGQHSVRVNDQWRVCFSWRRGDAFDVEIVDYHRG